MLTVIGTMWNEVTRVSTVTSSNVVLKFEGAGTDVLWVKGAPGLGRVGFANVAMGRSGLPVASRILQFSSPEYNEVIGRVRARGDNDSTAKLPRLQNERWDLMVMPSAGQATYQEHMDSFASSAEQIAEHIRLLSTPSIQQDIARIIAADLLLGNFDRFGFKSKKTGGVFHMGNFAVDLTAGARFVPIDNDVVSPSLTHVTTAKNQSATPEMLYATVIHGGSLKDPNAVFPSANQSNLSEFLGANAAEVIYEVLNAGMVVAAPPMGGLDPYAQQRQQLRQYAAQIAPMVKQCMIELLDELKNPGGQREGLNKLMQAQAHLEGMDYDTFKLKSRFASLMVAAQNLDPLEVERRAQAYQKYRVWKSLLVRLMANVTEYQLPAAYKRASNLSFLGRGVVKVFSDTTKIDAAHTLKKDIRKNLLDEQQFRQKWEQIKDKPDADQSIIKAKVLLIVKLYYYDLTSRAEILKEVKSVNATWVDQFYIKAIRKRKVDLGCIVGQYRRIFNADFRDRMQDIEGVDEWETLRTTFKDFEEAVLRA